MRSSRSDCFRFGLGLPLPGDVAADDHASPGAPTVAADGPAGDADEAPRRGLRITHEHLDFVRGLTRNGAREGKVGVGKLRDAVRLEDAVRPRPLVLCSRLDRGPEHPPCAGVEDQVLAVFIRGDHAVVHAVEHRLHAARAAFQPRRVLPMAVFPLAQGKGGLDGQVQLPLLERLRHVAQRTGRLGSLPQLLLENAVQVDHRDVQRTADPFGRLDAADLPSEPEVDQGHVGTRGRSRFHGLPAGRHRGADRIAEFFQTRLERGGRRRIFLNNQYVGDGPGHPHPLKEFTGNFTKV